MVKQDVFDYVMQTRYNTNPNQLTSMLANLEETITEELEENIEDHIPADKKLVDKDAEILPSDAAGFYYTIEGSYDSSIPDLEIPSSLTEEKLAEYFNTGIVKVICSDISFIMTHYNAESQEFTFTQIGGTAVHTISFGEPEIG